MVSVENSGRYDIDVSRQRRAGRSPYATWQLHATTGRRWPRPRTPRPPQPGPCPGPRPASGCGCHRVTSRSWAKAPAAGGRAARDPPPGPTSSGRVRWCSPATSVHDALEVCRVEANRGADWVLEGDVSNAFGNLDHEALMAQMARRVCDRQMLK